MAIHKEHLEEFKRLYSLEYGKDISDEKACELATNLMQLFKEIYRPLPKDFESLDGGLVEES